MRQSQKTRTGSDRLGWMPVKKNGPAGVSAPRSQTSNHFSKKKKPMPVRRIVSQDAIKKRAAGGEATNSLDLGTLDDETAAKLSPLLESLRSCALEYGLSDTGSGTGRNWTVVAYLDGSFEVTGMHTSEGLAPPSRKKPAKTRATERKDMDESTIERTMRRTKKTVRQKAKQLQPDKLITLTTREPIVEADVFKAVVQRFYRLCRGDGLTFEYVTVFERHMGKRTSAAKYGSLHLHMATKGYVDYNVIRKLWRDAVQWKLRNGDWAGANIDSSVRKNGGHFDSSSIARYIAKYLSKDMDDEYFEPNKKRYWCSRGIQPPEKVRFFSPPAMHFETFRAMWEDIIGLDIVKLFQPDRDGGQPPIIWMATG